MKKSILKKALCLLMVCCQVFAFAVTAMADDEQGGVMVSPTFIHVDGNENTN